MVLKLAIPFILQPPAVHRALDCCVTEKPEALKPSLRSVFTRFGNVLGFIGLAWAIRHEYRARHEDDPDERQRAQERARKAAAKGPSDAEIEDRLLDGASSR